MPLANSKAPRVIFPKSPSLPNPCFEDAKDFLAYAHNHAVPLAVLDVWMPKTSGLEVGCFIEGDVGSNQALGKEADFGKMIEAASEFACGTFESCTDELNWHEHFQLLMRHPVINAGVQIAAWHRYRLPEDLLST